MYFGRNLPANCHNCCTKRSCNIITSFQNQVYLSRNSKCRRNCSDSTLNCIFFGFHKLITSARARAFCHVVKVSPLNESRIGSVGSNRTPRHVACYRCDHAWTEHVISQPPAWDWGERPFRLDLPPVYEVMPQLDVRFVRYAIVQSVLGIFIYF